MGRRYQQHTDKESAISFRVVEIYLAGQQPDGTRKKTSRFLLVDNRRETLETVQLNMHDFIRNALRANSIETAAQADNKETAATDFSGILPALPKQRCFPRH